jgi:hypothetical protein
MATRKQNEHEYTYWVELPDGGRRYWRDRRGAVHGFQRIVKIVDASENTLFLVQEVYNDANELIGIHQKYPIDLGHQHLKDEK